MGHYIGFPAAVSNCFLLNHLWDLGILLQQGLFEPAENPWMNRTTKQAVHSWYKMIIGLTWGNSSLVILFCQLYYFTLTHCGLSVL